MTKTDRTEFLQGFKDSFPVFVGYFAVAITLGITASGVGLSALKAALMSFLNVTSAGQAAAIQIMGERGTVFEIAISQIAINLRYLLMAASLTVKLEDGTTIGRRLLMSLGITDEIFGLSVAHSKELNAMYTFGGYCMAMPGWVIGTVIGVLIGKAFPAEVINALSIGIYVMFIAIIVPPSKQNKVNAVVVISAAVLSTVMYFFLPAVSLGIKVVILTVVISCVAALVCPIKEEEDE